MCVYNSILGVRYIGFSMKYLAFSLSGLQWEGYIVGNIYKFLSSSVGF